MRWHVSPTVSMALLIGALALLGQWVSQVVSADVLEAAIRGREIDKISTVGRVVGSVISERGADAQLVARLLSVDQSLAGALQFKEPQRTQALAPEFSASFRVGRVQTLEVTDTNEIVVYRAHNPPQYGDKAAGWGVAEALTGTGMLVSARVPEGVVVRAIEPLRVGDKIVGTVAAGVALDRAFFDQMGESLGVRLALLGRQGLLGPDTKHSAKGVDAGAMTEAFSGKVPIYRIDATSHQTSVYLPVTIVDEAYVVLAQLDSTAAYQLIDDGKWRSAKYALWSLIGSVVLGLLALRVLLKPLARLRQRVEQTALQLTGESINPSGGDEVNSVVRVLDTLTDRLVQRNRELEVARVRADAANQAKSQFLSSMSHEIRTPLNGVLGMAELLQSTQLNPDQSRFVGAITSAGQTLHDLLSDILDLAKIEEGRIEIEQIDFDPRQTVADVVNVYREVASKRSLVMAQELDPGISHWVRGDPTRFRQILSNLLGNAIKFTERGQIHLRGERIAPPAGDLRHWCRFTVQDTGIGIAPQDMDKLFQRFVQAHVSTTRHFGGTGLGLAICKHLVELMAGHIHAQSTLGQGTRIWFELPFDAPLVPQPSARVTSPTAQRTGVRVMVAEDNAINQMVAKHLLTRLGADVTVVDNGEKAVQLAQRESFDIIFMDCQMPVMDGFEATRQIRAWEKTLATRLSTQPSSSLSNGRAIPIVALTANAFAGDRDACIAAGMNDYLAKPVTSAALALALARHRTQAAPMSAPPASAPTSVMAGLPAFDATVLATLLMEVDGEVDGEVGGDAPGFADRTLALFSKDAQALLAAINHAAARADRATLMRCVHSLKSSGAQVGALALSAQAGLQETMLRTGRPIQAEWPARLRHEMAQFDLALAQHRATESKEKRPHD